MRLNKYLAHAGVGARRAVEELIVAGRVRVNGKTVRELATDVAAGSRVEVDNVPVRVATRKTYWIVNKPAGVMTTMSDPQGRRTIVDLIPRDFPRIVPVGRLDYDTSGVLLLTDDGDLANTLSHPRFGVDKTYRAVVRGRLLPSDMRELLEGVRLDEFRAAGAKVRVVASRADVTVLDITIHEGKNRQVRRMLESVEHPVVTLTRTRFGPIALGSLAPGQGRAPTARELAALRAVGSAATD